MVRELALVKWLAATLLLLLSAAVAIGQQQRVEVSTDFAGGNVIVVENKGSVVRLKPDLRGGRDWFYWNFAATAAKAGDVDFVFDGKLRIGVRGPAVSEDGGLSWNWLGSENVRFSKKGEGGESENTESFRYHFATAGETRRFAVAIPYLSRELDAFLGRVEGNPRLKISSLATSRGGREVDLLQIGEAGEGRAPIIVTARHHACESMASYVLEGFLEAAMSDSVAARSFRERYVLYAVPMMDSDGVEAGDQGKWRFPHDHNRDYGNASIYSEVQAVQDLAEEVEVSMALDFHCPSLRGETHEVFYFIGVGLPHIRANTDELRGWIDQERPQVIRTGPFNFLRDPPEGPAPSLDQLKGTKFSVWFAYRPKVRFAATFEIPYSQASINFDAAMARDYGRAVLRAWERCEFVADPETRSANGNAALLAFRRKFSVEHKSKPNEAESDAIRLLETKHGSSAMRSEARYSLGLLRLRQRRYQEAREHFSQVIDHHDSSTTEQREMAMVQWVITTCRDPESDSSSVAEVLAKFEALPYRSAAARFESNGAAAAFFEQADDPGRAFQHVEQQLPYASKIQKGATLNYAADLLDQMEKGEQAIARRRQAVEHLRGQLEPMPGGHFWCPDVA